MLRQPDRYAQNIPERHRKKWEEILISFMQGDLARLRSIQRTGSRGRIFYALVRQMLHTLAIPFRDEPIFDPIPSNPWYVHFSQEHKLKLRMDSFYNPDFFLEEGTWLEVTLSENTAYKKLLKYGHQTDRLIVLWLDVDQGLHKSVCERVVFSNAKVERVDSFYDQLRLTGEEDLIRKFEMLKGLKGILL